MIKFSVIAFLSILASFVNAKDGAVRLRTKDTLSTLGLQQQHDANAEESIEDIFWGERELVMSMDTSGSVNPCVQSEQRTEDIIEFIKTISDPRDVETEGTPQNLALNFVLDEEPPSIVCLNDPDCGDDRVKNRYLMALLYYSTLGDNWNNCAQEGSGSGCDASECEIGSDRWLGPTTECDWCGLSCANVENLSPATDGCQTTDISIEDINQSGVLPFELGADEDMRQIKMEEGTISGGLPAEWSDMVDLRVIDLNDQELTGEIPDTYYTLDRLQVLDLDNNELTGGLSPLIGNLVNLQFLEVGMNNMGGPFPAELGTLSQLLLIGMEDNNFVGEFPDSFAGNIETLRVQNNQFTGDIDFLDSIASTIKEVDLSGNGFSGIIPSSLEQSDLLERFSISFNNFFGEVMPPGMESLLSTNGGELEFLSADCEPEDDPPVECKFCTFCTVNPDF